MINSYDWGRQIQMSFYSGPVPYVPEGGETACGGQKFYAMWHIFPGGKMTWFQTFLNVCWMSSSMEWIPKHCGAVVRVLTSLPVSW
jgi:hypothetical protein